MALKKLFGEKLKEIRKQKGLTQEELAELCDMQTNSIGLIEVGQRAASFSTIELLANKLDVSYSDFFNFDTLYKAEYSNDKMFCMLYKLIKNFDNNTFLHLLEYVKLLKRYIKQKELKK